MRLQTWKTGFFLLIALLALSALLSACGEAVLPATLEATATPTRTPRPTSTPVPTWTPTPAWPVSAGCADTVKAEACLAFQGFVNEVPELLTWRGDAQADVILVHNGKAPVTAGQWVYVLAAPFFTLDDEASYADIQATWRGTPTGTLEGHPLVVAESDYLVLSTWWGMPGESVKAYPAEELLTRAQELDAWALVPFDALTPKWKVLRVDGINPLEKGLPADYPLRLPLGLTSVTRPDALTRLQERPPVLTNRDENRMAIVAMTGVTAMCRGTASLMERAGVTYPARDIGDWLRSADITHISNEVSFRADCTPEPSGAMSFCSNDKYIALLEEVGTDVIELTGNHLVDRGIDPLRRTLEMYRERGWQWFGGGENYTDARQPALFEVNGNKIAFIGCNTIDNPYDWATNELPGVFSCRYYDRQGLDPNDLAYLEETIGKLKEEGYNVIFTLQYYETYEYAPYYQQIVDFRTFAEMGPVYVQGSQAHQPQTMEFYGDTFVHYGLGNLFFDQMWSEPTRQGFVNRLVFYDNRLVSIELRTIMNEEFGRPRPMTERERRAFLKLLFDLSARLP